MSPPPTLLEMPHDVMDRILENVSSRSILVLRKVCRDLRNFIDDVIPDANWKQIYITVESPCKIVVKYKSYENHLDEIEYRKFKKGCLVAKYIKEQYLEGEDLENIFLKDLEIMLKFQKSILDRFIFDWKMKSKKLPIIEYILEHFQSILKSRPRPLQVTCLSMEVLDQSDVMNVLPFVDSEVLEQIGINHPKYHSFGPKIEIDEIVELDQWKKAFSIGITGLIVDAPMRHFIHFARVHVTFQAISASDLKELKEALLHSSKFEQFRVNYADDSNKQELETFVLRFTNYYFRMPNTIDKILNIYYRLYDQLFIFYRLDLFNVPKEAVIHNS